MTFHLGLVHIKLNNFTDLPHITLLASFSQHFKQGEVLIKILDLHVLPFVSLFRVSIEF